jgi:hypothetical protein
MMQAKAKSGNPVLWTLAVLLTTALLLVGLTSSASAGGGGQGTAGSGGKGTGTKHGKCKKKSNGGAKSSATNNSNGNEKSSPKKKCGKKPEQGKSTPPSKPVTPPATPPATPPGTPPATPPVTHPAAAALAINSASFDFGTAEHGGFEACGADPDPNCPTHAFTVTNTGGSTSGVPTASIVETRTPESGVHPAAFQITANTCTAALAPGASCSITVKFAPNSNAGDLMFSSRLDVTAAPGSTVSSVLSGTAG